MVKTILQQDLFISTRTTKMNFKGEFSFIDISGNEICFAVRPPSKWFFILIGSFCLIGLLPLSAMFYGGTPPVEFFAPVFLIWCVLLPVSLFFHGRVKRNITVYKDKNKHEILFQVKQEKGYRFLITDKLHSRIGSSVGSSQLCGQDKEGRDVLTIQYIGGGAIYWDKDKRNILGREYTPILWGKEKKSSLPNFDIPFSRVPMPNILDLSDDKDKKVDSRIALSLFLIRRAGFGG